MRIPESKKLVTFVSILLVAGFLATSLASYYVSKSNVRETILNNELPLTADNIYSEIQRDLLRPIFISSLMAQDTFLRDWSLQGEKKTDSVTKYLSAIMERYGTVTSFFISERTRVYYHATGALRKVLEEDEKDKWYFRVRQMKPDYEINVDSDYANRGAMTIFINYRVFDYDGNFIGVTGVGLAVESVKRLIENYKSRYKREVFFVNRDGALVMAGESFPKRYSKLADIPGYQPFTAKLLSSTQTTFQYKRDGETVLLNSRYIPELEWFLIVEQVEDPSLAALKKTLYGNLAVCLVVTLIVLGLTNYTVHYYQRRLRKMATTDKLTGLLNRQAFDLMYDHISKEAMRSGAPLSLIIFDIDHFKKINDSFGHMVGDSAIGEVVGAAQSSIRASDILCRWGGEEFIVLLGDCAVEEAFKISEAIRANVEKASFMEGKYRVALAVSLGVAQWDREEDMDHLIHRADEALYKAKHEGRNRTVAA